MGTQQIGRIASAFCAGTKASVTPSELGLFAASGKRVVACPEGYCLRGNVDIVCERYGLPQVADLDGLIRAPQAS